jgi:cell division protein FtsN
MKNKEYRELQITSSQLVVIFLAIIILGIVIFLLGVSVGKKQALAVSETQLTPPKTTQGKVVAKKPAAVTEENLTTDNPSEKPSEKPAVSPEKTEEETIPDKPQVKKTDPIAKELASHQKAEPKPQVKPVSPIQSTGQFYIQVGAYKNRDGAYARANDLKTKGYSAQVFEPSPNSSSKLYKVQIGGFPNREEAEAKLSDLARTENKRESDYFIVKK